ncbi:hypothetical protein EDD85DRAFT_329769 [Armillaria nabsnona]|nr:hypothetical protein EDD85DRAFT_329769 [Armillaria nabsnona]
MQLTCYFMLSMWEGNLSGHNNGSHMESGDETYHRWWWSASVWLSVLPVSLQVLARLYVDTLPMDLCSFTHGLALDFLAEMIGCRMSEYLPPAFQRTMSQVLLHSVHDYIQGHLKNSALILKLQDMQSGMVFALRFQVGAPWTLSQLRMSLKPSDISVLHVHRQNNQYDLSKVEGHL